MSRDARVSEVVPVHRASLWVAAVGFIVLAIGSVGPALFAAYDELNFTLSTIGPWIIAAALLIDWRRLADRCGRAAVVLFVLALVTFGALWLPYAINPENLGNEDATLLGFIMAGSAAILAALGIFLVMARKEAQLDRPNDSGGRHIEATFMQLLIFGVGFLLYGVDFLWVGDEATNHAQFSLLVVAVALMLIGVISFRAYLTLQMGRLAVAATMLALLFFVVNWVLHMLPIAADEEWRLSLAFTAAAYVLGGVACALAAVHKANASGAGVSPRSPTSR